VPERHILVIEVLLVNTPVQVCGGQTAEQTPRSVNEWMRLLVAIVDGGGGDKSEECRVSVCVCECVCAYNSSSSSSSNELLLSII